MPKIIKILISILIAISIAVTPFATGFNVKSEAVAPVIIEAIKYVIAKLLEGAAVSAAGTISYYGITEGTDAFAEWLVETENTLCFATSALEYENGVNLEVVGGTGDFSTEGVVRASLLDTSSMTEDEKMFAEFFVDYVNSNSITVNTDFGEAENTVANGSALTVKGYEGVKNAVTNAYNELLFKKAAENEIINAKTNLKEALGDGAIPTYNFDFVGPMPTLELPTLNKYGAFVQEGYYHSLPITIDPSQKVGDSFYYIGEAQSSALVNLSTYNGAKLPLARYVNDSLQYGLGAYNCSQYILHDGKIYYACIDNAFYDGGCSFYNHLGCIYSPDSYIAADGTRLSSTDFDANSSFQMGYVANIDGVYKGANPAFAAMNESATTAPTEGDFTTTTGGAISIPKTIAETVIGNAIEMGLLNPDSVLGINENGEIVTADGIELAKLQEMVDGIAAGNLELENIEEYLSLISKLITSGNLTAKEHTALLENIKTSTAAISAVIATKGKVEIDTPDVTIIDKFPFCLPFDLYYVFSLLCTEAKEPVFTVPIKTTIKNGGLNYSIDEEIVLDLTCFKLNGYDMVQIFTQSTTMLLFIVCLISATKKLMWS